MEKREAVVWSLSVCVFVPSLFSCYYQCPDAASMCFAISLLGPMYLFFFTMDVI